MINAQLTITQTSAWVAVSVNRNTAQFYKFLSRELAQPTIHAITECDTEVRQHMFDVTERRKLGSGEQCASVVFNRGRN